MASQYFATATDLENEVKERQSIIETNAVASMTIDKLFAIEGDGGFLNTLFESGGIDGISKVNEGDDLPIIKANGTDKFTAQQVQYAGRMIATKSTILFKENYAKFVAEIGDVMSIAWGDIDQFGTDVLRNAYNPGTYISMGDLINAAGIDGLPLASDSHTTARPGYTFSNIITDGTNDNPVPSVDAIQKTIHRGQQFSDDAGKIRPINFDTFFGSPTSIAQIRVLTETKQLPGGYKNDINPLYGRKFEYVEMVRFRAGDEGLWGMVDSKNVKNSLKLNFTQRPELAISGEVDSANLSRTYSYDTFFSLLKGSARNLMFSNSTNT